ncbi:hypothetical protein HRF79_12485 [Enterococcus faecalis]|nr:hypothetical protein [Enterococcus faecalis]
MNSIIGEMDLTKYFILLIFPFFLLYIFKFFLNQSFVRKSNIPKRELKEQKINLIELQKKSFVYYSFLLNIYFVLHLVMVIFLGMFLGSFYEYGYFTNQSNAISYAFLTLVTALIILLINLLVAILRIKFLHTDQGKLYVETHKNVFLLNSKQKIAWFSIHILSVILAGFNILLFLNSTVY